MNLGTRLADRVLTRMIQCLRKVGQASQIHGGSSVENQARVH